MILTIIVVLIAFGIGYLTGNTAGFNEAMNFCDGMLKRHNEIYHKEERS